MPGKTVVAFLIQGNIFFTVFQGADNAVRLPVAFQLPVQPESVGLVLGILPLVAAKVAFGEAQVINGIQQVGFAAAITAGNTHNALFKGIGGMRIVLELGK